MNDDNELLDFWQNQYDAGTMGWDRGTVHPPLFDWIECGELTPCQIVVPGCGHGHEVVHLCMQGFDVTAIDYAPAAIDFLADRLDAEGLQATLLNRDLFAWRESQKFDVVYEQTCLCAIKPDLRTRYADRVYDWLRPGGKLLLLMVRTDIEPGPPFDCDPDEMKQLFSEQRWEWQSMDMKMYDHPSGRLHELATVLIRK